MDTNTTPIEGVKRNSVPKWLQIFLIVGGVFLIAVGLFQIFGGSGASNTLVDKFNALQAPAAEIKDDLTNVSNILSGISAKEASKDYTGIISDLQTALVKLDDASAKVASIKPVLDDFQNAVNASSSQNIKAAGMRLIDAYKSRNAATLKMVSDAKDLVNQAITYYNEVAKNQKITIDVNKFSAAANAFAVNAQSIKNIGAQYDAAASDFAKAAGFTIEKK
jgi:hypothetical protein